MTRHARLPHRTALWAAIAVCAATFGLAEGAKAADLGPYGAAPRYAALPPSPCEILRHTFDDALHSMRRTAKLFRGEDARFHRLKRVRANDGFVGPDITLNQEMTADQIDVATQATVVAKSVWEARRFGCLSQVRLNLIDNEASRIKEEIAETAIWIDPRTFQ